MYQYLHTKTKFLGQGVQKLEHKHDRQTDAKERITSQPHLRVAVVTVQQFIKCCTKVIVTDTHNSKDVAYDAWYLYLYETVLTYDKQISSDFVVAVH